MNPIYFAFAFLIFAPLFVGWKMRGYSALLRRSGIKDRAWGLLAVLFFSISALSGVSTIAFFVRNSA